jgi:tetratricopeptide (TPR) repeat protein
MKKYQQQDLIEEDGDTIFRGSLNRNYFFIHSWGDKNSIPNTDGELTLRDGKGNYLNKTIRYQLKSVKSLKKNKFTFTPDVIEYQLLNIPTISIVVDVSRKKTFWYYFPSNVDKLGLNKGNKSKTIDLTDFEIISNSKELKELWEKIAVIEPSGIATKTTASEVEFDKKDEKIETSSQVREILNYETTSEYQSELDNARDLINNNKPFTALSILEDLKKRVWNKTSDNLVKFRILTNIAASKLALDQEVDACKLFLEALQYNPDDEKALANVSLAYLLSGDSVQAITYSLKTLDKNPSNPQALSVFLQAADKKKRDSFLDKLSSTLKNSPEVYFSLGFVEQKKDNFEQAIPYLRKALELDDGKSLEIPSTLAGALIEKNVPILKKLELEGLTKKDNDEVKEAITLLDKVWAKVENTELAKSKVSWLVNRSFAKRVLGMYDEAYVDAKKANELDADNFNGIRNFAILSFEMGKYDDAIRLLEPFKNSKEFTQATYLMGLVERERKDFDKAIALILSQLEQQDITDDTKEDGLALLIETYLMAGKPDEAEKYINDNLKKNEKNLMLLVFKSKLYQDRGQQSEAIEQIKKAYGYLTETSSYHDKFMVGSQLYRLQQFKEAQAIYEEIVDKSVYSQLLYRLLYTYYETNSYAKALALSRSIIQKQGPIDDVLKLQAAILEEQGDQDGVIATYDMMIENNPNDTSSKIQKGFVLLRQNKFKEVDKYLDETTFDLETLSETMRFRLGYLYALRGKVNKFLTTIYETRRKFYDDEKAHIEYIQLFFLRTKDTESILVTKEVKDGTAVIYKLPSGQFEHFVIDDRDDASKALKEIRPSEELAKKLTGKKVGDKVEIKPRVIVEITEIKSKYVHALHESMALHQSLFSDTPSLQSIQLGTPKKRGELPEGFDVIEKQITAQYDHAQKVEALYKSKKITIGAFANLIGRNIIEVWGGMVAEERLGINYARGDLQERIAAVAELKDDTQLVADPIALLTIHSLDIKELLVKAYGKFGVAQSTLDLINQQISQLEPIKDKGYLTLGKQGEQFTKWEVKPETIKKNIKYLTDLSQWIKDNCEILPITEMEDITKEQKEDLEKLFGIPSIDTVLLARTKGKLLFSDDQPLREVSKNEYRVKGIWTQALLMSALGKGFITQEQYDDYVLKLVGLNYYYTSVSGKNLFYALGKANWKLEEPFKSALKMLEPSFTDMDSSINVAVDFLYDIFTQKVIAGDVNAILFSLLDSLTKDRLVGGVLGKLIQDLRKRFYLIPLDLKLILEAVETWNKSKIIKS